MMEKDYINSALDIAMQNSGKISLR